MPKLYIHAGQHKTGTTSIQRAMFVNRESLREQGVLYPQAGLATEKNNWGHHAAALSLGDAETGKDVWGRMRREADEAALDTVVVSSEILYRLPFGKMSAAQPFRLIAEHFAGYDIRLLVYLRPQVDLIASNYSHNVKAVGETASIVDFITRAASSLDYMQFLHLASVGLGESAIEVGRYDKPYLTNGDVVEDFARRIGIDLSRGIALPPESLNRGLSDEGLARMLEANRRYANSPLRLRLARKRILEAHRAPPFTRVNVLSDDMCRTIEAIYRLRNRNVAARFLGEDGDLFPPRYLTSPLP
ncbi:hypothetical protein [Poseidonocella pacifica]|nr:hypothetical protein [Poseidonocella pacifica]